MPQSRTVLLTGAAGRVGTMLRRRLPAFGWSLRLLDRRPVPGEPDAVVAPLSDTEALRGAARGVDAIVHLAAHPGEAEFEEILRNNMTGSFQVYEAAREEGVPRVVAASSNHAIGCTPVPGDGQRPVPVTAPHRPDTYYGLSKCFGEDLAQLYWERLRIETVSLRIGACEPTPVTLRQLSIWLSPGDCARLVHAALTARRVGHTVVYGCSDNTRGVLDNRPGEAIGYRPQDDSEVYAERLLDAAEPTTVSWPAGRPVGGAFADRASDWPRTLP